MAHTQPRTEPDRPLCKGRDATQNHRHDAAGCRFALLDHGRSTAPGGLSQSLRLCRQQFAAPTYPHILAFALQMQLLTDKTFPFPLLGLIHLSNRIRLLRPMGGVNRARVSVQVQNLQPHAKGATFDLVTTLDDQLGVLWEAQSQMLCRGVKLEGEPVEEVLASTLELMEVSRWQAPADIGRQYAKVSGDYNPIHLSVVSARLFGFPTAIAHGLWNKARTIAALSEHLPAANVEIAVQFRKPVRLPSEVTLLSSAAGSSGDFQLLGAGDLEHMVGHWRPVA